jgi:hypothetical protein
LLVCRPWWGSHERLGSGKSKSIGPGVGSSRAVLKKGSPKSIGLSVFRNIRSLCQAPIRLPGNGQMCNSHMMNYYGSPTAER